MSVTTKRDRDPNCPKATLADAIEQMKRLYSKAGKAQIAAEVAVTALGYAGMNGAALTSLGTLNQYGLIDRERGSGVSVSPLAIKLIHPLNSEQERESRREAALKPRVFSDILTDGLGECAEDVLANHLIQNGFSPDGAKRAAFVFKANSEFANLGGGGMVSQEPKEPSPSEVAQSLAMTSHAISPTSKPPIGGAGLLKNDALDALMALGSPNKVLARYSIPLGSNEATIIFTGEILSSEDFDALGEYVKLFKKQFERTTTTTNAKAIAYPIERLLDPRRDFDTV
jgi:hypothetical protein